ncbi:MAG: hypothetical protein ACREH4_16270 [Vitreimonas sp.]
MSEAPDKRDLLHRDAGAGGVAAANLEAACRRICTAGGALAVWGVLREDMYETRLGDGFYLHLRGLALNRTDAERLAALPGHMDLTRWHVRPYQLRLRDGAPALAQAWRAEEEFSINDFVEILAEIPPAGSASMLMVGDGAHRRTPGLHMLSLP